MSINTFENNFACINWHCKPKYKTLKTYIFKDVGFILNYICVKIYMYKDKICSYINFHLIHNYRHLYHNLYKLLNTGMYFELPVRMACTDDTRIHRKSSNNITALELSFPWVMWYCTDWYNVCKNNKKYSLQIYTNYAIHF